MLPPRYNVANLKKAIKNPQKAFNEIDRLFSPTNYFREWMFSKKHGDPIKVMEEDWDFLFILDACRYDVLDGLDRIDGQINCVPSEGSHSREFASKNFAGESFHDTVYVTANGHGADVSQDVFHDLIFTDEDDFSDEFDTIHPSMQGMAPSTVHNAALDAYEKYPNKRIIVHFMQPHAPYFGERAEELRDKLHSEGFTVKQRDRDTLDKMEVGEMEVGSLMGAVRDGLISKAEFREAYMSNLEEVLDYADSLLEKMDGRTVITSDHGELLGESGEFGHSKDRYEFGLRMVPWVVMKSRNRPEITTETPTETNDIDDKAIEKRLRTLGYRD